MMLELGAHTDAPRWSSRVLEETFEHSLRLRGATLSDVVKALFSVLSGCPPGLSDTQANFIREVAVHVVGRHRRAHATENFSWLASAIVDPNIEIGAAQAYLAAYVLPVSLISQCRDVILLALGSTRFEAEVRQYLDNERVVK